MHKTYGVLCKQQHEEFIQLSQQNRSFLEQLQRHETVQADERLLGDVTKKLDCVYKELDDANKTLNEINRALEIADVKLAYANDFATVVDIMILCSFTAAAGVAIYYRK